MMNRKFEVVSSYEPAGDQPKAIKSLAKGIIEGLDKQTLLGVTGSGKTYTIAKVIEEVQKPTLVIAHNKTLAAQLYSEFKEFFPNNSVEYFVSYYDYYQPEAYIPMSDTYIEKDSSINEEIDRLRHSATAALFERKDVIIVASVSCIYGLGNPEDYEELMISLRPEMEISRDQVVERLVDIQYTRNDIAFERGRFRVRGDVLEIFPSDRQDKAVRVEFFGDEIEKISEIDPLTGKVTGSMSHLAVFPASHFATNRNKMLDAIETIKAELVESIKNFKEENKLIEAQRIEERTMYDIEMMRETGFCSGIENYSRHITKRKAGVAPYTLLDYFPEGFMVVIDESHVTTPQVRAMYNGDRARKKSLVDFGFRLPSAYDNRPLQFEEFTKKVPQTIYVSATPSQYEKEESKQIVEQIIRPTGLIDPEVIIRPVETQVDDLLDEIHQVTARKERILVTTLTKKMSEDLTKYFESYDVKVKYLHSDIDTLERVEILRDLRLGVFDVLIGINLLREGLDIPEVSLVAILDADKEGLFRSETSLIQTIGRAARNEKGRVILYADMVTNSMRNALDETNRRRQIQIEYNKKHGIIPKTIFKSVRDSIRVIAEEETEKDILDGSLSKEEMIELIETLTKQMRAEARKLEFEKAAQLRDQIEFLVKKVKDF